MAIFSIKREQNLPLQAVAPLSTAGTSLNNKNIFKNNSADTLSIPSVKEEFTDPLYGPFKGVEHLTYFKADLSKYHYNDLVVQGIQMSLASHFGTHGNTIRSVRFSPYMSSQQIINIINMCPNLTHIDLSYCVFNSDVTRAIAQRGSRITSLNLARCECVDDNTITCIAQYCRMLRILNISNCSKLTDKSIFQIAYNCLNLSYLDINFNYKVSDSAIEQILIRCRALTHLNIENCWHLSYESFKTLASEGKMLKHLKADGCVRDITLNFKSLITKPIATLSFFTSLFKMYLKGVSLD